ncbi:TIGR02680 family protein [Actinomadura xylanilytica]|uniref:TIGR02680 family protein n=1 Tax=Actinomadura xylanilytica TaxID=887459 RepID=UPI00255AC369|nr:TIGR02680 family protein [Actinomadura xylanilytica]MDL4774540.1 TIGR02680 family protein [Actinomadura xylanilytica]
MIPLPMHPHRFRLSRAGIHQVWQYDEEFLFGGGRLLLRGKNGAGKSKALEMLLPFLLDGDTRRLDAAGGGKTTLKWLMLDGWTAGTNRLGYLWVEFARPADGGPGGAAVERLTLVAAVKASTSTGEAKATYFVTPLTVGDGEGELPLGDPARRPALSGLRELIGQENCYERAADYRSRVARELFGLTDMPRYRNLVHLLYGLRRPTIGDRIESGELVKVLSDALPPLDDEIIDKVARNLDDLDTVRDELARLERTDAALTTFLAAYRGYLRGVLRGRVGLVGEGLAELKDRRRQAGDAERALAGLKAEAEEAAAKVTAVEEARDAADADLRALREGPAYGALKDLRDKRATVQAMRDTVNVAWSAAGLARQGEATAAARLGTEAEEIGRDLTDLRGSLRDARGDARSCGLDEALLGEPPVARAVPLAAGGTETVTGPDGQDREVVRPAPRALDEAAGAVLTTWRARLGEADQVVKARRRATDALTGKLREVEAAENKAGYFRQEAEQLDGQLAKAQERQSQQGTALATASGDYAARVRDWAERLPEPDPLLTAVALPDGGDDELPLSERVLGRDVPDTLSRLAHESTGPVLDAFDGERDEALARERTLDAALAQAEKDRRHWEEQADPEPPRSAYSTAGRHSGTGAPLFLLLDFAESVDGSSRAGLEAALEAAGLLGAWVSADGTVLTGDTQDVVLHTGDIPLPGPTLADVLQPVPGHGVSHETLDRLLHRIGLGDEPQAHSWIAGDGRWRLGVAHGAYRKDRPEYIGAGVRAATRRHRIDELTARIDELAHALEGARAARADIEHSRDRLRLALREAPSARPLTEAWAAHDQAAEAAARLTAELTDARRAAEQARAAAVKLRARAQAQATADSLPDGLEDLARLRADLDGLRARVETIGRDAGRVLARLSTHAGTARSWERSHTDRTAAETAYRTVHATLNQAHRELKRLEGTVGATERQIIEGERDAQRRFDEAQQELPRLSARAEESQRRQIRAEFEREGAVTALGEQERIVVSGGGQLRRPLGLPGLALAAALGDLEPSLLAYDSAQDGDVRTRITALRSLADDVGARLGAASSDISGSVILRRGEELRDGLAGGYDAGIEETDGVKRFALHDDTGAHDAAVVGERIRAALTEARLRLSDREQEVFERYLLGELGDHLSRQVLAAHGLVTAMNDTLDQVRSSHGIGARLHWDLADGGDADVKAAVTLLRRPSALRTRDQSEELRDALRRRIEEARLADPSAGYAVHLRTALDYRAWFAFKVKVTDAARPDRERVLSHRTALSQGEQRVVSYLVLFATAAAHFSSLGDSAPAAPRLILLDDAFAKVDEPTHGRLLGLLVELDLDFVITSERLWGCFPTVPSLHIYECLRDPHARGVATVHFTWDGQRKRLVSV